MESRRENDLLGFEKGMLIKESEKIDISELLASERHLKLRLTINLSPARMRLSIFNAQPLPLAIE